jgi:uncharacterized protein
MAHEMAMSRASRAMKIRYLDGHRFRRAVLAGVECLHGNREHLNRINVFPIPDADTGTNLSLTMRSAAEGLKRQSHRSIALASRSMAQFAILGSQGNSGAILAQFLKGLSDGMKGKVRVTTQDFANAVERARHAAYAALGRPREGTILTVMKEWSEFIASRPGEAEDFVFLLRDALAKAKESLRRTPDLLPVLKEHGVVDAGAQGFVHLLEGITDYVESGRLARLAVGEKEAVTAAPAEKAVFVRTRLDLPYRYCAECVLETATEFTRADVEEALGSLGDSLVVAGGEGVLKVHLHTNEPDRYFKTLEQFGSTLKKKLEDMKEQHLAATELSSVAVVTDSACDLPEKYVRGNGITVVPLKLIFGEEVLLDRIDVSPSMFLGKCQLSAHHPKTSQPSVSDYLQAYEKAAAWAREVVVVCLSSGVSGTLQAASMASAQFDGARVRVVDTRSVSVGEGLLVQEAQAMAAYGADGERIVQRLEDLTRRLKLFISLKSLDFARRGGRVSIATSVLSKILRIRPVISFDAEGRAVPVARAFGDSGIQARLVEMALLEWKRYKACKMAVAHVDAPELAAHYVKEIKSATGLRDVPVAEATPVLAAHAGPGAAGIAVLGLD